VPCPLEAVIATNKLALRPSREPDHAAECKALTALAAALASDPDTLLMTLAETVMQLCRADSGGVSILESGPDGEVFRWRAIAGKAAQWIGGTIRRAESPCALVIDDDAVFLFDRPDRHFGPYEGIDILTVESLLVPFHVGRKAMGTVWALSHRDDCRFDAEDARLLTSISGFASAAYQLHEALVASKLNETARDDLLRRVTTAQEEERRRVARDLHDQTGQLLTALALAVKAAEADDRLAGARDALTDIRRLADDLGRQVHDLAVQLRPSALDDLGLAAALEEHLARWGARSSVKTDLETAGLGSTRLPPLVETVLYRVVQECLTNVVKHARATRVSVVVERHDGHAIAIVEDDGAGFDSDPMTRLPRTASIGLLGMRERVTLAGGRLDVEAVPGQGTTVIARIPLSTARGGDS